MLDILISYKGLPLMILLILLGSIVLFIALKYAKKHKAINVIDDIED